MLVLLQQLLRLALAFDQLRRVFSRLRLNLLLFCGRRSQLKLAGFLRTDVLCPAVLRHQFFELLVQRTDFFLRVYVLRFFNGCRILAGFLELRFFRLELLQKCVVLLPNLYSVLRRVLGGGIGFFRNAGLLGLCGRRFELVFPVCFGSLRLCTAALGITTNRGQRTAQHGTANEAVNILFAGVFVGNVQPGLQALQHLLRSFGNAFSTCSRTGLSGVVQDGFAKRLVGQRPRLLRCQLRAYGAEQLTDTGDQRHSGGVKQCLWDGCGGSFAKACFFQRLAGFHLSAKVRARKLPGGHRACA